MQTAEDFRDLHQLEKSFKFWRDYTVMKQVERKQNLIKSENHYDRYTTKTYKNCWPYKTRALSMGILVEFKIPLNLFSDA